MAVITSPAPAAAANSPVTTPVTASEVPVPEGFRHFEDIARYQEWLEESYQSAISASARELISEVVAELALDHGQE